MQSTLVPERFKHKPVRHTTLAFSTAVASTIMATAPGTGLTAVPVYYRIYASAIASAAWRVATTAGSVVISAPLKTINEVVEGPWWDDQTAAGAGANNNIVLQVAGTPGNGQADLWYIVVRSGAGDSGTGL